MEKLWKEWKWVILAGVGILLLALGLRLYNLTLIPVFVDEAIYIRWAQVMRAEPTLRFLPLFDGKQPLFMWLTIPFLKIFSDPLFAARLTSVFAGMGTTVGIFLLTYYLFKEKKVALLASFIYAISPFGIFFDRMALVDSMLCLFGIWTIFLGVITAKTLRLDFAMLTGFALGAAMLTKSTAVFFEVLLPFTTLFSRWPKGVKNISVHLIKLLSLGVIIFIISFGLYNILRLGPNFQMITLRNKDYVFPFSHILTSFKDPLFPHIKWTFEWLWTLGPSIFIVLIISGILVNLKKYFKEIFFLVALAIGPNLIQSELMKVYTARYIFFTLPYLAILVAANLLSGRGLFKKIIYAGFVIFIVHALFVDKLLLTNVTAAPLPRSERSGYLEDWTAGTGIREVSDLIREELKKEPNKKIVVGTEGFFGTLPDGLEIYLNDKPEVTIIGVGVAISDTHPSLLASKKAGNKTYLLVNDSRFFGDADKLGLKLIASYPKAVRPDGTRQMLLFFEVTERAIDNSLPRRK